MHFLAFWQALASKRKKLRRLAPQNSREADLGLESKH
jgi:hypothetical protein